MSQSLATIFSMKSTSPASMWHSRTMGQLATWASNFSRSFSAWDVSLTRAKIVGMIGFDVAGVFEGAHATEAWRSRDTDIFGELYIRHTTIILKVAENFFIDFIEFRTAHVNLNFYIIISKKMIVLV